MSTSVKSRALDLRNQFAYVPATLRLIWEAAGSKTVGWAFCLVLQGLLPAAQLFLIRPLVDSVVAAMGGGMTWANVSPVVTWASAMGATILLQLATKSVVAWFRIAQAELVRDHLATLVHEKATAIDMAFYEMPAYHDLLERVRGDLRERPLLMLESFGGLAQNLVTLVAMAAILLSYGLWLPILLLLSALPVLAVVVRHNRRHHAWWQTSTTDRRWAQYYDTILSLDAAAAELRVFRLGPFFQKRYSDLRSRLRGERLEITARENRALFGAGLAGLVVTVVAIAWMVRRALIGQATLGDIALLYQALNKGQALTTSLMTSAASIYSSTLFLGNLFEFLELEPEITDPPAPTAALATLEDGIEVRGISFRYPGSDEQIFENFSLRIPAGKIVAIMGANGAGKSTLMKLLCRFYDPEQGSIHFDGVDIKEFPIDGLRRMLTGLFQFPVPYLATARENIAVGDIDTESSDADVVSAAQSAGAHELIAKLPGGYDTLMGKWFKEGTQLSGGEWQRVALARAFIRRAPIMILDEPTSHLDSWAEADWFDRLRARSDGRTTLLITHRLATAQKADTIHVMDAGRMVESGTHQELLALGGRYAQSWRSDPGDEPAGP